MGVVLETHGVVLETSGGCTGDKWGLYWRQVGVVLFYLLGGDLHVVLDVRKHGGLHEEALVAHALAARAKLGALLLTAVHQRQDLTQLVPVNLNAKCKTRWKCVCVDDTGQRCGGGKSTGTTIQTQAPSTQWYRYP